MFLFQIALLLQSFMVSLRLISSSSSLDSNCLWVWTGLVPPVATCLWLSGDSLGLGHLRKGWRPPENNIYLGALVKTWLTPFFFVLFVLVSGFTTDQRCLIVGWKWVFKKLCLGCHWKLFLESWSFSLLPPESLLATNKILIHETLQSWFTGKASMYWLSLNPNLYGSSFLCNFLKDPENCLTLKFTSPLTKSWHKTNHHP